MPHPYKPGFSEKLHAHLQQDKHGRSLRQLARLIKRSPATLHRWLRETRHIPYNDLIWLCRLLELKAAQRAELLDLAGYEVDLALISERSAGERGPVEARYQPGFGQTLRRHLAAEPQNRTQRQLAAAIGRSPSLLNHWLAETRQIPYNDLICLCRVLGLAAGQRAELMTLAGYEVDWPPQPEAKPVPAPLQRPPRPVHFTGRQAELAALMAQLQPGRVVTLCGPGGIGKSALAAEALWRLTEANTLPPQFPDGIVYHSFYNQPQANLALQHIVLSFGQEPRPTPRQAALRTLAGKQALLVLDGSEEADDLGQVLDPRGDCGVLITSRRRQDAVEGWEDIRPLPPDQAVTLLQAWGRQWGSDVVAAQHVCALIAGLPLAVRLVGRYLAQTDQPITTYLAWLESTPLQALDHGSRRLESVPLLLKHSLEQVSSGARAALQAASLLALRPFSPQVIASALDISGEKSEALLVELVNFGLLLEQGEEYEISHALIHAYGCGQGLYPDVLSRLAAYYVSLVQRQSSPVMANYALFDTQRGHIVTILTNCINRAQWQAAQTLAGAVYRYFDTRGFWAERIMVLEMGLKAARQLKDVSQEVRFLGNLGLAQRDTSQLEEAMTYIRQGIALAQTVGDQQQEGACLGNLALIYQDLGQHDQAVKIYQQAATISEASNHRDRLGYQLIGLATNFRVAGQTERAIHYSTQALTVARETGDRRLEGISLTNLGASYRHQGQFALALEYGQQAIAIARKTGDRRRAGAYLGNLGMAHYAAGQLRQASVCLRQAVDIAREIKDQREESNHLGRLGLVYCYLKQPEQALLCTRQALELAQIIGDRYREANHLGVLALAHWALDEPERAIDYGYQALSLARELGDRRGEAHHLRNLGLAFAKLKNLPQARRLLTDALATFDALGSIYTEQVHQTLIEIGYF